MEADKPDPCLPLQDVVENEYLVHTNDFPHTDISRDGMTSSGSEFLAGPLTAGSEDEKNPRFRALLRPTTGQLLMPSNEDTNRT